MSKNILNVFLQNGSAREGDETLASAGESLVGLNRAGFFAARAGRGLAFSGQIQPKFDKFFHCEAKFELRANAGYPKIGQCGLRATKNGRPAGWPAYSPKTSEDLAIFMKSHIW